MADVYWREEMKRRQERVFRVACDPRRYAMTLIEIAGLSGIPYSTIRSYAGHNGEPAVMSLGCLWQLQGVLPDELLAVLMPQAGEE